MAAEVQGRGDTSLAALALFVTDTYQWFPGKTQKYHLYYKM